MVVDILTGHPHDTWFDGIRDRNVGSPPPWFFVAAVDALPREKEIASHLCDGTADDVQIQEAIDALPAGGGMVVLSSGLFTLAATISRAIDNVIIRGMGGATRLVNDASTTLIDSGTQGQWLILDLETDGGGVDIEAGTNSRARFFWNGVYREIDSPLVDPGDGNAIGVLTSGRVALVTTGAETRTLAAPSFIGQQLLLYFKTDGGNCVTTCSTVLNDADDTIITMADVGEAIGLIAIEEGSNLRWRVLFNDDGVALSTV